MTTLRACQRKIRSSVGSQPSRPHRRFRHKAPLKWSTSYPDTCGSFLIHDCSSVCQTYILYPPPPQMWNMWMSGLFLKHGSHVVVCSAHSFGFFICVTLASASASPLYLPWYLPQPCRFTNELAPQYRLLFSLLLKTCATHLERYSSKKHRSEEESLALESKCLHREAAF